MAEAGQARGKPVILPLGGGKGGIGKSALAANLAIALARLGQTVALVDADLGGSDLHNLLGLANDLPGLGEVLAVRGVELKQVIHPTTEPRLLFVPGDALMVATANPSFQKKRKLLHAMGKLATSFVILDLGAGTALTVMDFFLVGPLSLLVMTPERTSLLNAFNFLKNVAFRVLEREFRQNSKSEAVLQGYRARGRGPGAMRMAGLVVELARAVSGGGERARNALERLRPKLILNRARRLDDLAPAGELVRWARDDLGLALEVLGFVPEDPVVAAAAARGVPALELDPRAPFCQAVALLAQALAPWAGKAAAWAARPPAPHSFEAAATRYAGYFTPRRGGS